MRSDSNLWRLTGIRCAVNLVLVALAVIRFNPRGAFSTNVSLFSGFVGAEGARFDNLRFDPLTSGWFASILILSLLFLPSTLTDSAVIASVLSRLDGRQLSVGGAFKVVATRFRVITGYALINVAFGAVTRILDGVLEPPLRLVTTPLTWGWIAVTALTLPILVATGVDPVTAIRRSASLFRTNWGLIIAGYVLIWLTVAAIAMSIFTAALLLVFLFSAGNIVLVVLLGLVFFSLFQIGLTVNYLYDTAIFAGAVVPGKKSINPSSLLAGAYGFGKTQRAHAADSPSSHSSTPSPDGRTSLPPNKASASFPPRTKVRKRRHR